MPGLLVDVDNTWTAEVQTLVRSNGYSFTAIKKKERAGEQVPHPIK